MSAISVLTSSYNPPLKNSSRVFVLTSLTSFAFSLRVNKEKDTEKQLTMGSLSSLRELNITDIFGHTLTIPL